jgi:hypothetical protein
MGKSDRIDGADTAPPFTRRGRPGPAAEHHQRALDVLREIGEREGQALALNGLGEAAEAADRPAEALAYHTEAWAIATETGARDQQVRAEVGRARNQPAIPCAPGGVPPFRP